MPPSKRILKKINAYSKGDRAAIIVLSIFVVLALAFRLLAAELKPQQKINDQQEIARWESLVRSVQTSERGRAKKLFRFNPNTISEAQLDSLDLPVGVGRNLLRYRKAGGRFVVKSDMGKIYGMSDSIYQVLHEHILLPEENKVAIRKISGQDGIERVNNKVSISELEGLGLSSEEAQLVLSLLKERNRLKKDAGTVPGRQMNLQSRCKGPDTLISDRESTEESDATDIPELIDLNTTDTAELICLPGIGSVYAARIVKYRNLLGGFHSSQQLLEVYGLPEETVERIAGSFQVEPSAIKKIKINFAGYGDLIRHPYLSKTEVREILKYRRFNGRIRDKEQLREICTMGDAEVERIAPYIEW